MTVEIINNISELATKQPALRSLIYSTFAEAFEYPDQEMLNMIRSGAVAERFRELLGGSDPTLIEQINWAALTDVGPDDDALQVEFTRLFDTGTAGPPCALYGGHYSGVRMKIMEELVRFYNFFGLSMSEQPHELPDHLTTQLEFLHYLSFRETELVKRGDQIGDLQRAQRDFISRHPARWLSIMSRKLDEQNPPPFFHELTRMLLLFLQRECKRLVELHGPVSTESDSSVVQIVNI